MCTGMHKKLPGAKTLPDTAHHGALVHHGTHRYPPVPKIITGRLWAVPDTWSRIA
jgi:hypothetical protein